MSAAPSNPLLSLLPQVNAAAQDISAQLQQAQSDLAAAKQQLASAQIAAAQQAQIAVGPSYVQPGDLGAILAKVGQPNTTLQLGAGTFTGGAITVSPALAGLRLLGVAGKTTMNLTAQPGTAGTGIAVRAPMEVCGVNITGTATAFRVYSTGFYLHDFSADQLGMVVNLDSGGDDAQIRNGDVGTTFAQGIFCTADGLRVSNYRQKGSVGEHPIRFTNNGSTGHIPANAILTDLDLSQVTNVNGKEVLALRRVHGITLQGIFRGWMTIGEFDATSTIYASGIRFLDSQWTVMRPDGTLLQIRHDADVFFDNCRLIGNAAQPCMTGDARARLILRRTDYLAPAAAGQAWKDLATVDPTGSITRIAA